MKKTNENAAEIVMKMLAKDAWKISKKMLTTTKDLEACIFISELVDKQKYCEKNNMITKEGTFPCSIENMKQSTRIKKDAQKRCIDVLVNLSLIECSLNGMPRQRHFKINHAELDKYFL